MHRSLDPIIGQTYLQGEHLGVCLGRTLHLPMYTKDGRCSLDILNMKDNDGESALMIAVCLGNIDCVKKGGFTLLQK